MKAYFKNIQSLLIVVLAVVLLLQRNCSGPVEPTERIIHDTIIEYVTIEKEYPVYVPQIKYITKVDIDTFNTSIDTSAI